MKSPCAKLKNTVEQHFPFLAEGGYRIAYESEWGGDGCVVGLEGRSIRIKFYTARDEDLNILVGDGSAPFEGGTGKDGDAGWYYLRGIAGYIDLDLSIGERFVTMASEDRSRERVDQATNLARLVEDHLEGIEKLFAAGFENVRRDYEQYNAAVAARTRAAYEARARKS